jgi:hypothetical protein
MSLSLLRHSFEVPCTVEIEHTGESLHAHVSLDGVHPEPGDEIIVKDPPAMPPFGEKLKAHCTARVTRGNFIDRLIARGQGYREITELYEVGFSDGSENQ